MAYFQRVRMDSRSKSLIPSSINPVFTPSSASATNTMTGPVSRKLPVSCDHEKTGDRQDDERADLLGASCVVHPRRHADGQLQGGERRERSEQEDDAERARREKRSDTRLAARTAPRRRHRRLKQTTVSSSAGSSDPSTFAASSSNVVIGVASSGSSVRACFSPITL